MQPSTATDATADFAAAEGNADQALGRRFAEALGRKDFEALIALLDAHIDFRGLTPRHVWEASDAHGVVHNIVSRWFEDSDELEEILSIETGSVSDRRRVSYRFRGRNADGPFLVEQQAYYTERDGRINWMRVLCSGLRPG
jgi:hypothetical protein